MYVAGSDCDSDGISREPKPNALLLAAYDEFDHATRPLMSDTRADTPPPPNMGLDRPGGVQRRMLPTPDPDHALLVVAVCYTRRRARHR